jgi:zinc transport system ATP-binding protein
MQSATAPVLAVEHLSFTYQSLPVLEDVSFQLHKGDFLGLVGPNGSGKTTLLKIVLGLLKPESGQIRLFGQPAGARPLDRVGYVSQKAASFQAGFPATAAEVISSGLAARHPFLRRFGPEQRSAVEAALEMVGLGGMGGEVVSRLSGGQQQRVFIARALVSKPELLIMDEPTVGVDPGAQDQFYALIRRLRAEMDLTVLLVSHDIGVVTAEVTHIACLNRKLFFHGAPADFDPHRLSELYGHKVAQVFHYH